MKLKFVLIICFLFIFSVCAAPALIGQTSWGIESGGPTLGEFNSPPPLCVPLVPPYKVLPPPPPLPGCPGLVSFPFACDLGGSAVDNDGNFLSGGPAFPAMLHSDGMSIVMADAITGTFIISWPAISVLLPGPVCGLGYDSTGDVIWVTDGVFCAGYGLSPSCSAPLPVIFPPFPLPLAGTAFASGLDWDPCTGTLWFSDCAGSVINCTTTGVPLSIFPTSPTPLTGLTVNTATVPVAGMSPNLQITDGFVFAEMTSAGAVAPTTSFHLAANPYVIPAFGPTGVSGLGFSLSPVSYGVGCPSPAGTVPKIGFTGGYPFVGNAGFALTMSSATPGTTSYLVADVSAACPPLSLPGCPGSVWVSFPWLFFIPVGVVPATGTLTVPVPIPPAPGPCGPLVGTQLFCQFINVLPGPTVVETSDALVWTIGDA